MPTTPHSLHVLIRRWCWQMLVPPHSLHSLLWKILAPPQSLTVRRARLVQARGRLRLPDPHHHRLASTGGHSLWLSALVGSCTVAVRHQSTAVRVMTARTAAAVRMMSASTGLTGGCRQSGSRRLLRARSAAPVPRFMTRYALRPPRVWCDLRRIWVGVQLRDSTCAISTQRQVIRVACCLFGRTVTLQVRSSLRPITPSSGVWCATSR